LEGSVNQGTVLTFAWEASVRIVAALVEILNDRLLNINVGLLRGKVLTLVLNVQNDFQGIMVL
jgi:hypothetical protein